MSKRVSICLNKNKPFKKIDDILNTKITKENISDVLLSMSDKDVTNTFMMSVFGKFNGKSICNPYDTLIIPKFHYALQHGKGNKNEFITTVGGWIFNKYFLEPSLYTVVGYINETVPTKVYNQLNEKISFAFIEDKISVEDLSLYLMKSQAIMAYEDILTPNHTEDFLTCSKKIDIEKNKLLKQYKNDLESTDGDKAAIAAEIIQNQLIKYAKELLNDDPAMDTFLSGAQGSIENNFKNIFIMKGAVQNPDPNALKKYNVITSNYIDGVSAEDYTNTANALSAGPYSRGKKTADGGYWEKLFGSAFQHVILGDKGSDCKSTKCITVKLDKSNFKDYMYNYISNSNGTLTEITSDNYENYLGKVVKIRFSSLCKSPDNICNVCAGNLWYRLDIKNIGVVTPQIASKIKLICMKAFHDSQVTTVEMDPMKAFGIEE